jgi:hypothetical protein
MPGSLVIVCPPWDSVRGQLGTIVAYDRPGLAALYHEAIELTRDSDAGDRGIRDERQAFPRAVIDRAHDLTGAETLLPISLATPSSLLTRPMTPTALIRRKKRFGWTKPIVVSAATPSAFSTTSNNPNVSPSITKSSGHFHGFRRPRQSG